MLACWMLTIDGGEKGQGKWSWQRVLSRKESSSVAGACVWEIPLSSDGAKKDGNGEKVQASLSSSPTASS